jgi:hypothetical protein
MKLKGARGLGLKGSSEILEILLSLGHSIFKTQLRFDNQILEPMTPRILEPLAINLL